jgi:hypothetical protein
MVLSPEGGGGCSCGNWFETSMVMAPKSRAPFMFKFEGETKFIDTIAVSLVMKKGVEGKLFYTTDGSEPDKGSTAYEKPVVLDRNTNLRAAMYYNKEGRERKAMKEKFFERLWPSPKIETNNLIYDGKRKVSIEKTGKTGEIHYTTDGTKPTKRSPVYKGEVEIGNKTTFKAVTVWDEDFGEFSSDAAVLVVDVPVLLPAVKKDVVPGLNMNYYEGLWHKLPDFSKEKVVKTMVVDGISLIEADKLNDYGMVFSGYIKVSEDGIYKFYTRSDDGSALYIDGKKVVDNDGEHTPTEKSGKVPLAKGLHEIRVEYFQSSQGQSLGLVCETQTSRKRRIPGDALFH